MCTRPFSIGKVTVLLLDLAEARIQLVAQPVAEGVEGHYVDEDGEAGDGGNPPGVSEPVPAVGHHGTRAGGRRNAERGELCARPFSIGKVTVLLLDLAEARIQLVAQPVAEEVEGHYGDEDGEAGDGGNPPGVSEPVPAIGHHGTPGGFGWRNACAEEAE